MNPPPLKRNVIRLTLLLFVLGYYFIVKAGISDVKHLLSILVSSYLIGWGAYALTAHTAREEIRSRFVLITLSLGVGLLLVEVPAYLQWIDYRNTFAITSFSSWKRPGYLPDRELLSKPKPHHSVKIAFNQGNIGKALCLPSRVAEPFELRYDQNGFRNEHDLTSAEIAVIGDSYVESPMVPSRMLATTRLADLQHTTVANLGQSGYGPQQELTVLKRYALPLHPKSVVWVFYEGNDLVDANAYPGRVSVLGAMWDSMNSVAERSFTINSLLWVMRTIQGCVPQPHFEDNHATVKDAEGREQRLYFMDHSTAAVLTTQELDALQQSVESIGEAYRLVQHEGIRFLVAFAPTKHRVYRDIADFEKAENGIKRWEVNDLPDRLRKMLSDISPDIEYLDLTPMLKSAAKQSKLVFFHDDTHWSSEGHRVVAQTLSEALTAEPQTYRTNLPPEPGKGSPATVLSKDAVMVRNADGTIKYWSEGAYKLYGWEPQLALGMSSHRLLKTVFPAALDVIEAELGRNGYWEGLLIHERRDGSTVSVVSHWELQQNPISKDQSITVIEINSRPKS